MEVQVEVSHAKSDRRNGIIAAVVIHAVIILVLIWAVLPKTDPPLEELGGTGMEIGLGGIEGEGAEGAPGGREPQPSEQTPVEAAMNNKNDATPQEDLITNSAEDPIKVAAKSNPSTSKNTSKTPKNQTKQATPDPVNKNLKDLKNLLGSGGGDDGGGGNGQQGSGPGSGKSGAGKGAHGTGPDASNGKGNAKPTRILTILRKEDHNCSGASLQHVKIEINRSGKITKVMGNAAGTIGPDECFKRRAEQYVLSNYVYAPCSDCNAVRYDEAILKLESTDQ